MSVESVAGMDFGIALVWSLVALWRTPPQNPWGRFTARRTTIQERATPPSPTSTWIVRSARGSSSWSPTASRRAAATTATAAPTSAPISRLRAASLLASRARHAGHHGLGCERRPAGRSRRLGVRDRGVADVGKSTHRRYYLNDGYASMAPSALGACGAGYHMASLWEICTRRSRFLVDELRSVYIAADSGPGPTIRRRHGMGRTGWFSLRRADTVRRIAWRGIPRQALGDGRYVGELWQSAGDDPVQHSYINDDGAPEILGGRDGLWRVSQGVCSAFHQCLVRGRLTAAFHLARPWRKRQGVGDDRLRSALARSLV